MVQVPSRAVRDGLDVVPVRIDEKRRVVVLGVVEAEPGPSVVLAPRPEAGFVEFAHAFAVRAREGHMPRRRRRTPGDPQADGTLGTEAHALPLLVEVLRLEAERCERLRVEGQALVKIANLQ